MKYSGINRDLNKSEMPEGLGVDARNGINSKILGAAVNEGGFKAFQNKGTTNEQKFSLPITLGGIEYTRKQCGEVQLDLDTFLICSVGYSFIGSTLFSEIGFLSNQGQYTAIIRDLGFSASNKLNFSLEFPVTGEYTKNYLNETLVALTDDNNKPLLLNVDFYLNSPALSGTFNLNSALMFPSVENTNTNITINDTGGNLDNGTYYLVYRYYLEDFSFTNGLLPSNPIHIFDTPLGNTLTTFSAVEGDLENKNTNKSIAVFLPTINSTFKGLKVYGIIKRQGIITAKELKDVRINGQTSLYFTIDSSIGTDVDYKSLITPSATFNKVYAFTQVVKRLYAAKPKVNQFRDFQKHANKIRIKWKAERKLVADSLPTSSSVFNYDKKSFAPREVMAFYLHLELVDGTITEGFNIPALSNLSEAAIAAGTYRDTSGHLGVAQGISCKRFQIEDTCTITNAILSEADGEMGLWENEELYPDLPEYDSRDIGGIDLRGRPVRHHRFPSLNFFRENKCFNIEPAVNTKMGVEWLPSLGIMPSNVVIPDDIKPFVNKWFISYAKRDYTNSTVIGSSTVGFQSMALNDTTYDYSSGFNLHMSDNGAFSTPYTPFYLNRRAGNVYKESRIRFQDFNLVKNTPDINPVFITNEFMLRAPMLNIAGSQLNNSTSRKQVALIYDFTNLINPTGVSVRTSSIIVSNTEDFSPSGGSRSIDARVRKVDNYKYLSARTNEGFNRNQYLEDSLLLTINSDYLDNVSKVNHPRTLPIGTIFTTGTSYYPASSQWYPDTNFQANNSGTETYLSTLMNLPSNVYVNMFEQELVNTGVYFSKNLTAANIAIYKGDCFNGFNSYHTGGWGNVEKDDLWPGIDGTNYAGLRALWIHLNISPVNYALRTSDTSKPQLQFFPKNPFDYYRHIDSLVIESNKQYNSDYSSINDIRPLIAYNPFIKTVDSYLYRINRSITEQSESQDIGWRSWLINDYYEIVRNKGQITNIQGADRNLIIQTENSTFVTVGNEQLDIGTSTAFIGAGNIFERPAMEYLPSKEGSIGTTDRYSCMLTGFGYVSVDRRKGTVLLLGESPKLISNQGLSRWLFENLNYSTEIKVANRTVNVPNNPYAGFGIHCGMDYEFNRLIITKKYYELTDYALGLLNQNVSYPRLRFENNIWVLDGFGIQVEVGYDNEIYFKNKGFTVSYDLRENLFTYFHDYSPVRYMTRRQSLIAVSNKTGANYPFISGSNHFIMNQENKGIFENTVNLNVDSPVTETAIPYAFYIVPIISFKSARAQLLDLRFQTESVVSTLKALGSEGRFQKDCFSSILVFNSHQSTPIINTVQLSNNPADLFNSNIRLTKGLWIFNKLKDWLSNSVYNSGEPFILDFSKLDTSKIDLNKSKINITPLTDQWFAVKISYNNSFNLQLHKEFRILQIEFSALPVSR